MSEVTPEPPEVLPDGGSDPAEPAQAHPASDAIVVEREALEPVVEARELAQRTTARRDMIAAWLVILAVVGGVVGKKLARALAKRPTEDQCAQLVDHYVEHASRQHHPDVRDDDIARAQSANVDKPERLVDLSACQRRLTAEQVDCGLKAANVDDLERCVQ